MLRKLEYVLLGGAAILLPFAFEASAVDQFRTAKVKAFCALVSAILAFKLWRTSFVISGFYAISVISLLFISPNFYWFNYAGTSAVVASCLFIGSQKDSVERFLNYLIVGGFICATYGYFQIAGKDPFITLYEFADKGKPMAFFGQYTLYGPFAVACFAAALFKRSWLSPYLAGPIFWIDSSFTYFSFAVVVAVFICHTYSWKPVFLLAIIALAGGYHFRKSEFMNDKGRLLLWGQAMELHNRYPWLGYGYGSWKQVYPPFQNDQLMRMNGVDPAKYNEKTKAFSDKAKMIMHIGGGVFYTTHNDPIQVVFEFGRVGMILILFFVASLVRILMLYKTTNQTAALAAILLSVLANSLGSFPFHLVPQVLLPVWAYVLLLRVTKDDARLREWLSKILISVFSFLRLPVLLQKISDLLRLNRLQELKNSLTERLIGLSFLGAINGRGYTELTSLTPLQIRKFIRSRKA